MHTEHYPFLRSRAGTPLSGTSLPWAGARWSRPAVAASASRSLPAGQR